MITPINGVVSARISSDSDGCTPLLKFVKGQKVVVDVNGVREIGIFIDYVKRKTHYAEVSFNGILRQILVGKIKRA